jgi:hypothetical protein
MTQRRVGLEWVFNIERRYPPPGVGAVRKSQWVQFTIFFVRKDGCMLVLFCHSWRVGWLETEREYLEQEDLTLGALDAATTSKTCFYPATCPVHIRRSGDLTSSYSRQTRPVHNTSCVNGANWKHVLISDTQHTPQSGLQTVWQLANVVLLSKTNGLLLHLWKYKTLKCRSHPTTSSVHNPHATDRA